MNVASVAVSPVQAIEPFKDHHKEMTTKHDHNLIQKQHAKLTNE
jgi:hypothetical protein